MKDLKSALEIIIQEVREEAAAESSTHFHEDKQVKALDSTAASMKLDKRTGNKKEKVASYQTQFEQVKINKSRKAFTSTRGREKKFRIYLKSFRLLYFSYRRMYYCFNLK
jgi:hypothetical protein